MAKIVITIEDGVDEETQRPVVKVHMEADPPLDLEDAKENTEAQVAAVVATQALNDWLAGDDGENTISTQVNEGNG